MEEIEVKLTYKDRDGIIEWLKVNNFSLTKNKEIKDSYFRLNRESMFNTASFYRIREIVGQSCELTLKDSFQEQNGIKSRREVNVVIDDPEKMAIILESFGCELFKEHSSNREVWENREVRFEFIDYYKPAVLNIIEIEGSDRETIEILIDKLGDKVEVAGEDLFSVFDNKEK